MKPSTPPAPEPSGAGPSNPPQSITLNPVAIGQAAPGADVDTTNPAYGGRHTYLRANVNFGGENPTGVPFTISCGFRHFFKPEFHYLERDAEYIALQVTRATWESRALYNNFITLVHQRQHDFNSNRLTTEWSMFVDEDEAWYNNWVATHPNDPHLGENVARPQLPDLPPPPIRIPLQPQAPNPRRFDTLRGWVRDHFRRGLGRPAYPYQAPDLLLPHLEFGTTLQGQCLQAVSQRPQHPFDPKPVDGFPQLATYARHYYYPNRRAEPFSDATGLDSVFAAVAVEVEDFRRRIFNMLSTFNGGVGRARVTFSRGTAIGAAGFTYGLIYRSSPFSLSPQFDALLTRLEVKQVFGHQTLRARATDGLRAIYNYGRAICSGRDLRPAGLQNEWDLWHPALYHIQRGFDSERSKRGLFRHFAMAPHGHPQVSMVLFSTGGLWELLKLSKTLRNHQHLPHGEKDAIRNFVVPNLDDMTPQDVLEFWKKVTNFEDYQTVNHKFACSFRTDGVGVRISMRKREAHGQMLDLAGWLEKPLAARDLRGKMVASCDPGRDCTTYHAVVDVPIGHPNATPPLDPVSFNNWNPNYNRGFTTNEYYERAGYLANERIRTKWMNGNARINAFNKGAKSYKTVDHAALLIDASIHPSLRLRAKSGQQRALAQLMDKFLGGRNPNECVVAWGAAEFHQVSEIFDCET
ncbi:hypothetical protein HDU93_002717 [Gonapodya sp. JEL0774]|nr:hypothetical protein HDU93_002717 [Gonapodya sp. JEL0774]